MEHTEKWRIEHESDEIGDGDDFYCDQYWSITDGDRVFRCYEYEDAELLKDLLNDRERLRSRPLLSPPLGPIENIS